MSKIVQDYMLVEVIGSGQYGKVWKAQHIKTREPYAIKSISIKQISGVEKLREFVMSEISALEQMSNRNIVKYFGKLQTTNNIYLIFEFCNGGTLEDVIKKEGMIAEGRAMPMFDQILNAFSELHRLNIMHRDIKPSNILLEKGEIKLADFGFCKKMKGEFEMTKSIVGSPIYMAPELLQGRYYCTKADIWSLGVMLYEMLHGKCPYEENSIPTLLEKIKSSELRVSPGLSLETKQLLEGMLTFNPSSRISWNDLFRRLKSNDFYRSGVPSMSNTYVNTSQPPEQPTSYSYVPTTDSSLQTRVMGITNNPDPRIRDQAKLTPTPQSALDYDPLRKKAPSTMPMGSNPMGYYEASQNNSSLDTTAQLGQRPVPSYTGQPSSLGSTIPMQKPSQPSVAPRTAPDSLATAGRPSTETYGRRQADDLDQDLTEVMASCPMIVAVNKRLETAGLTQLPLQEMKKIIINNKKSEHEEFYEILKNRYCAKFILDKIKLYYLLDFEDMFWQHHMALLLFKKARKFMLTAKIKVSYADLLMMKEYILEPQQLVDYVESETNEFDQIYTQFLKEIGQLVREERVDDVLAENIDKPFELDDDHFKNMVKKTVVKIKQLEDENAISVANSLLDIYTMEQYLMKLVDFRDKEKYFENFNNRLTNRELRELVEIKLDLLG